MRIKSSALFSLLGLLLCLIGGVWLWQSYLSQPGSQPLRVVKIDGDLRYLDRASLQQQVEQAISGKSFFTLDMPALRQQVLALPWVAQVSVQRRWPDTLRMHITEQVAMAHWGEEALVNSQGQVFRPQKMPVLAGLPVLQGTEAAAPRVVDLYAQLNAQFGLHGLRIKQFILNVREEWVVHFSNDLVLLLGQHALRQRVYDFLRVYPQLLAKNLQRVDMRYEHGFAVRWQGSNS